MEMFVIDVVSAMEIVLCYDDCDCDFDMCLCHRYRFWVVLFDVDVYLDDVIPIHHHLNLK